MKTYICSDIHGSPKYLSQMLEKFDQDGDQLLILGDILYHGPRNDLPEDYAPKKVIELLNARKDKIIAVRGNCDAEVDQMVLAFPITADYNVLMIDEIKIFMSHGHVYSTEKLPPLNENDAFLYGHIHLPKAELKEGIYHLNPGSISLPKENYPPSYAVIENHTFSIFDFAENCIKCIHFNSDCAIIKNEVK